MANDFQPKNELEEKPLATHNGEMSFDQFMHTLLEQNVFIPVKGNAKIEGYNGGLLESIGWILDRVAPVLVSRSIPVPRSVLTLSRTWWRSWSS